MSYENGFNSVRSGEMVQGYWIIIDSSGKDCYQITCDKVKKSCQYVGFTKSEAVASFLEKIQSA